MGTVSRVLVRRPVSPEHADFGGLSSGASPVVVRLDVVPLPPRSSAPTVAGCRLGGYPAETKISLFQEQTKDIIIIVCFCKNK
jgi:hypothetical protein